MTLMKDLWAFLKSDAGRVTLAIGAIVISATIAITLFILNRRRKALTYKFASMTRVLTLKEEIAGRVRILFDDQPVNDVGLVKVIVGNSGTEPIRAADFIRPISFAVANEARIIDADVIKKEPDELEIIIQKEDQKVTITPTLFNSGDTVTFKLLIANFDGSLTPGARVEGTTFKLRRHLGGRWINTAGVGLGIVAGFAVNILTDRFLVTRSIVFGIATVTLLLILLLFSMLLRKWSRSDEFQNDYK